MQSVFVETNIYQRTLTGEQIKHGQKILHSLFSSSFSLVEFYAVCNGGEGIERVVSSCCEGFGAKPGCRTQIQKSSNYWTRELWSWPW
ncbi:Uncharacterized protein TCM_007145 [Theobroma cacao]|uniref:Uncharacterized protein n=1 Tax=Theobroma cacao TaxID=3641 RepID=A0A061E147_THECC|nr:Uncharacterized protein TCM_007145 [Theobroma cacao]